MFYFVNEKVSTNCTNFDPLITLMNANRENKKSHKEIDNHFNIFVTIINAGQFLPGIFTCRNHSNNNFTNHYFMRHKMQKLVKRLTEEDLQSYPIRDLVEGWFFRVNEISNGGYNVEGVDSWGRNVSRMGSEPEELLNLCKKDIEEMKFI